MASIIPSRSRLLALTRLRCNIFNTVYNPNSLRTGTKYIRSRLKGPSMVQYYPPTISINDFNKSFPDLQLVDFHEESRLEDVELRKKRGKGTPKKAKSKDDSRRLAKKKRK
ncbi:hypothetical protein FRC03_011568 [Tulasnella sp. 419]|nr:hypothetical protein FRC02_004491 [Tulasnella sp. 418]KAG8954097.1 hypothetical protein FRC03_011568 [Tulasnella sp. 419]